LQNKRDAQHKVLKVQRPVDASTYITKRRFESNQKFFEDGKGVGTLRIDTDRNRDANPSVSFTKHITRPADASEFTAYRGHIGVNTDAPYRAGGVKTQLCTPIPEQDGTLYSPAGDYTKTLRCNKDLASKTLFVDTTIRLSAMTPCTTPQANHVHSQGLAYCPQKESTNQTSRVVVAPHSFQNQGVGGTRIGGYYTPKSGFVEKKHGNDLHVNPKRIPTVFTLSNAPAHLKINDPTLGQIKPF